MNSPIIPIDMIRSKACSAFLRGAGRDDHGFDWHCTDAIDVWQAEWDRCAEQMSAALELAAECPP